MNPVNVPPWGCPWHGLVKAGQLELPNGEFIDYPQPFGFWYHQGVTHGVRHPDAPGDPRAPEQVAADAALGREWRSSAILAGLGCQLYGKSLGTAQWIYIDPLGARWLASTTLSQVYAATRQVTLQRFGDFGAEPESYTYTFAVPPYGNTTPALSITSTQFDMCSIKPDGSAALFVMGGVYGPEIADIFPWAPLGWIELSLSGPGTDCVPVCEVVKTRAQALGAYSYSENYVPQREWEQGPNSDPVYGTDDVLGRTIQLYFKFFRSSYLNSNTSTLIDRIVAMFYSPSGDRQELTLSMEGSGTVVATQEDMVFLEESYTGTMSYQTHQVMDVTFKLNGVAIDSRKYEFERTDTNDVVSGEGKEGAYGTLNASWTITSARSTDYSPGEVLSEGPTVEEFEVGFQGFPPRSGSTGFLTMYGALMDDANDAARSVLDGFLYYAYFAGASSNTAGFRPVMHSINMYSIADIRVYDGGATRMLTVGDCLTPAGKIYAPPIERAQSAGNIFGSWCPDTNSVARDFVPVCWV